MAIEGKYLIIRVSGAKYIDFVMCVYAVGSISIRSISQIRYVLSLYFLRCVNIMHSLKPYNVLNLNTNIKEIKRIYDGHLQFLTWRTIFHHV